MVPGVEWRCINPLNGEVYLFRSRDRIRATVLHLVGRKNHYGSRSLRGTEVAAVFYTLCETARLAGVDPQAYLLNAVYAAIATPGAVTFPEALIPTTTISSQTFAVRFVTRLRDRTRTYVGLTGIELKAGRVGGCRTVAHPRLLNAKHYRCRCALPRRGRLRG
jgi:hypothetical protein